MLSSVLYSLRLEGGGNVTEPPFRDLVMLILIGFNYFSSVSASGRGVIGHVTKGSLLKEVTIEQSACVRVMELAAS